MSKKFSNILKEEDITHQLNVEYTSQQNGVAEQANRTLVEIAKYIMLQANLTKSIWTEALNMAAYLRNRCAMKSLDRMTPIDDAWSKKNSYVSYLRTIESKVIVLNKGESKGKFQSKADEYILVSCSEKSKAYRLWKPGTKTVIKAHNVKIFEGTNCQDELSKETFHVSYLNKDNVRTMNRRTTINHYEKMMKK